MMKHLIALLSIALLLAGPAQALSQLQEQVVRDLRQYGYEDVDVTTLSTAQLAHIKHLATSDQSISSITGQIGAVLGNSLFDKLFK